MKKICFFIPDWGNRWIPYILGAFSNYTRVMQPDDADILFSAWCGPEVVELSRRYPDKAIITYLRRYELREREIMANVNWPAIDLVIFVSDYTRWSFNTLPFVPDAARSVNQVTIPNGIDVDGFKLREQRPDSKKIGMIASTRWEKNHFLATQILRELPKEYTLHTIGLPGSSSYAGVMAEFITDIGLGDRFVIEGFINSNDVPNWLADKDCLLSCSLSEGNPMNIIEGMAMGVQPVIHCWPGAVGQFPAKFVYTRPDEAANMIMNPVGEPGEYRSIVEHSYSLENYVTLERVVSKVVGELHA